MTFNESIIILKFLNNWNAWNKQFWAETRQKDLLDLVDSTEDYLTKSLASELWRFLSPGMQTWAAATFTMTDLTSEEWVSYQLVYMIYKDQWDQCERQQDALDKLQIWMIKIIAVSYVEICFNYEKNINVWYMKLKKQIDSDETTIKQEIKNNYKWFIKSLFKISKNLEFWIIN